MPLIKARSSSIMDNVDLRGQPTAATAAQNVNTTQLASTAYVRTALADLIDSAPGLLDTLNELAAAIGDDENFATTIANSIATKLALDGSTAMTGELTLSGTPTQNLSATTKQYVDDLVDNQMIYSTDDVAEGTTNLYYTESRVKNLITLTSDDTSVLDYDSATGQFTYNHPNSDGILEGATNQYFTQTRARNSISMNSDDATIISYSAINGEFTFTTPDTDKIVEGATNQYFTTVRARGAVSAGSNIAYDSGTGIISTQAAVWSVNTQTGDVVLDTDDISEGSTNLYFTALRGAGAISLVSNDTNILSYSSSTGVFTFAKPNTDAVAEGSANLYYTDVRVRAAVSASGDISYNGATGNFSYSTPTTDGVNEGSTNLYFLDSRARLAVSLVSDNTSVLDYDSTTGVFTFSLGSQTTDDVAEGSTNLYYLDSRARQSISTAGWGNLSYNNGTGVITISAPSTSDVTEGTNLYFTDVRARNAVSAAQTSGDGTFSYDNTTGVFTYVGPNDPDYRGAVSAVRASGDGDLQYDSATGVFTYTGPSAADTRAHFSATTVSGITYTQATGVFALASIPNSSLANDSITINGATIALGGSDTLNTDDITEGSTNLYYTQARFDTALAAKTTTDLAEGTNEYFTETRARNSLVAGTGVTYTAGTGTIEIGQAVGTTDNVTFNDMTVSGDLTVQGTLTTINSTTVDIADKNLTLAAGAANAAAADGAGLTIDGAGATLTYASGTDSWDFNKDVNITGDLSMTGSMASTGGFTGDLLGNVTGNVTGDLTGNVTGNVTGTVSDISNHTTDTLTEGTTNVYYTDTRSRNALSGGNSGTGHGSLSYNSTTGAFTFAKVTSSNIRGEVSANKVSGDGNFSYDSATGVFSYTGPSAADARAHFSADTSTGAAFDQATGIISLAIVPNASLAYSDITINGATIALGGSDTLDTDDIGEGATNQYFLDSRARNAISLTTSDVNTMSYDPATGIFDFDLAGMTTDEVAEGTTNLYYLDSRARLSISASGWSNLSYDNTSGVITITAPSTADVTEDASFKYFTDARARQAVSLTTDNSDALSYDNTTGVFSFTLNSVNTDEIAEGPTNFYFTTTRARNSISNGSNIDYDATTGVISTQAAVWSVNTQTGDVVLDTDDITEGATNKYFSDAQARAAITLTSNDTDILSYSSATGILTFVKPTTDAVAEGATNLYYTDNRADARIAAASIRDLSDVDADDALQDGYTLVWSSSRGEFVPQNIAVTATSLNFTGDGTLTSFSTGVEVSSIDNTQVYINGLIQAPTYSYTLSTVSNVSSIVFDTAPEANDYIFIRVSSTSSLTAGGILNEASTIDGGTY